MSSGGSGGIGRGELWTRDWKRRTKREWAWVSLISFVVVCESGSLAVRMRRAWVGYRWRSVRWEMTVFWVRFSEGEAGGKHTEEVKMMDGDGDILVKLQVSVSEAEGVAWHEAGEDDVAGGDVGEEGGAEGCAGGEETVEVVPVEMGDEGGEGARGVEDSEGHRGPVCNAHILIALRLAPDTARNRGCATRANLRSSPAYHHASAKQGKSMSDDHTPPVAHSHRPEISSARSSGAQKASSPQTKTMVPISLS